MKAVALEKAGEHLDQAREFAAQLDLANGFRAYDRAWSNFLSQVSRFYSKLEQGAKGCRASEPWFGHRKRERKDDPILAYIHHARNVDEHGLDHITAKTGSAAVTRMRGGATNVNVHFDMMVDSQGRTHVRNLGTNTPDAVDHLELIDARVELIAVRDRGVSYDPPSTHLGRPIVNNSPESVAALALTYLQELLNEAQQLPKH